MSRINRLPASPLASAAMAGLTVFAVFYVMAHEELFWWTPSLFEASLTDKSYTYWHRWVHLSGWETFLIATGIYVVWYLISQTVDGIYKFVRKHPWVPLIFPAAFVLVLIGRDLYTGYAVYEDRIVLRTPLSGPDVRTYRASDVASVEVGCHRRINSRKRSDWAVPMYRMTFRDGTILSPFDVADADFRNPNLMTAMLRFDKRLEAAGVQKIQLLTSAGQPVNASACFDRMEGYFHPTFHPAMRRVFHSTGTAGWNG